MPFRPLPAAGHARIPWKNGLGVSQTIAGEPAGASFDALLWQVGSTGIGVDCAFSDLPGMDRQFMVIEGKGVELDSVDEKGKRHHARVLPMTLPYAFQGDWTTNCRLIDGPVKVLNVMTRRGRSTARVEFFKEREIHRAAGETVVAVDLSTLDAWIASGPAAEDCSLPSLAGHTVLVSINR